MESRNDKGENLNKKDKSKIVIILSAIGVFIIMAVYFFLIRKYLKGISDIENVEKLLNAAMWAQVIISTITALILLVGLRSLYQIGRQNKMEQQKLESEMYRPLISDRHQSIKRFLYMKPVEDAFDELKSWLNDNKLIESEIYEMRLNQFRNDVQGIGNNEELPLLVELNPTLDHIESLINEYNYISKLILDGNIRERFATNLGNTNFGRIFIKISPFIELRRRMTGGKYASHFYKQVQKQSPCLKHQLGFEMIPSEKLK